MTLYDLARPQTVLEAVLWGFTATTTAASSRDVLRHTPTDAIPWLGQLETNFDARSRVEIPFPFLDGVLDGDTPRIANDLMASSRYSGPDSKGSGTFRLTISALKNAG